MTTNSWPVPQSRTVGLFTDMRLFYEALELAFERQTISSRVLEMELSQRLQRLLFVEKQSTRAAKDLIRELRQFSWIRPTEDSYRQPAENAKYQLTESGQSALNLYQLNQKREFLRALTSQMQKIYVIPGWFVDRLWAVNPGRQGEIVIPTPPRDWNPSSLKWMDNKWSEFLSVPTARCLAQIADVCPGAFPVEEEKWMKSVQAAWGRLSNLKPRNPSAANHENDRGSNKNLKYSPRRRLAFAMREAAVKLLFGYLPPGLDYNWLGGSTPSLAPRTYMGWCPRLEALELIFYTDAHPLIPGRLIFPTSVFRVSAPNAQFERVDSIQDPVGRHLWLHRPKWEYLRIDFLRLLQQEHLRVSARVGSLYVSLLDVRDEVCRQLRISASCFDEYLEEALRESILPESRWSISVETDIREDQRGAPQLLRRPVWLHGTPSSLIAITEVRVQSG